MKNLTKNLFFKKEKSIFYNFRTDESVLVVDKSHWLDVIIDGNECEKLRGFIMLQRMASECINRGVFLYGVSKNGDGPSYRRVIEMLYSTLDNDARIYKTLSVINRYEKIVPNFDTCNATNNLFVQWHEPSGKKSERLVDFVRKMHAIYPRLHVQSLKASILNSVNAPLSQVVDDGSLDKMGCLFSLPYMVNLHVEGISYRGCDEVYILHIPAFVKKLRVSVLVNTLFRPSYDPKRVRYLQGLVVPGFKNLPYNPERVFVSEEHGNLYKVVFELDDDDLNAMGYELPIGYGYSLCKGVRKDEVRDDVKFFSAINLELLSCRRNTKNMFYDEIVRLNCVSNADAVE